MKNRYIFVIFLTISSLFFSCSDDDNGNQIPETPIAVDPDLDFELATQEVDILLATYKEDSGRDLFNPDAPSNFTPEQNVYVQNALAINLDHSAPTVTLPIFKGIGNLGETVYYIITEASDFQIARRMGINYSPKLKYARNSGGEQKITINDEGRVVFIGNVDFSPDRYIEPGEGDFAFPPKVAQPGAIGDANYSPVVVLPSNLVLNLSPVKNATGVHDRLPEGEASIDTDEFKVTLQILDGFQGGNPYFYHLVTDAVDAIPATIELGIYAPRLANIPQFGFSTLDDESALLGFSPVGNGINDPNDPQRQGLSSAILSDQNGSGPLAPLDPINVFPVGPKNTLERGNNYSPLWDAHISKWTDEAIDQGMRRRITSFEDLSDLIEAGWVKSFTPGVGPNNPYVHGLSASNAIINCPVIAHPTE
ncbi:DUF7482 domain-containing protein [Aureivirga marina]|uniref:DUF7482 domain-containing protein n=1 Tax=Aureivirga marina TaxID=1182451 RepID=UPI0018C9A6BC|nr:hypothetical protein [Aureivirga marina]